MSETAIQETVKKAETFSVVPELCILRAARHGRWKLIESIRWAAPEERLELEASYEDLIARMQDGEIPRPDPWGAAVRRELYELAEDPAEHRDLSGTSPEELRVLLDALIRYADTCRRSGLSARDAARRAEAPALEELERLRQLGYL